MFDKAMVAIAGILCAVIIAVGVMAGVAQFNYVSTPDTVATLDEATLDEATPDVATKDEATTAPTKPTVAKATEAPTEAPTLPPTATEEQPEEEIIEFTEAPTEAPDPEPEPETEDESSADIDLYDLELVARIIYCEAGDCGEECQWLVGSTILNLADRFYDSNIEWVAYDANLFSVAPILFDREPSDLSWAVAQRVMSGDRDYEVMAFRSDYYHNFGEPYAEVDNVYFSTF